MIGALPDKGRADRILVSVGPGSFTGVRVGVAAARALGVAWKAEVFGYPTLQLVAAMALLEREECVTVCMNAGHGEWFVQNFDTHGWPDSELRSVSPQEAVEGPTCSFVAGNRVQEFSDLRGRQDSTVLETLPDARFALLVPEITLSPGRPPTPLYGRAPDATPQKPKVLP
jgi:tRNA threonylcarbamoyl adenosine modification protein YeaZ